MRLSLHTLSFSLAILASNTLAQTIGNGRLIVQAPDNAISCQASDVQWVWTGSAEDAMTNTLSVAVMPVDPNTRRQVLKRRSAKHNSVAALERRQRVTAINIAGGSSIPMSNQIWTWNSVGLTPGVYRMALTVVDNSYTAYSAPFLVAGGADTSCLGTSGTSDASTDTTSLPNPSSTAATEAQSSSDVDSMSSSTDGAVPQVTPTSTGESNASEQSQADNDTSSEGSHGNGGKIAAAVIVPLIAVSAVVLYFCLRRRKSINDSAQSRQQWSEKIFGVGSQNSKQQQTHTRNISHPANPIHAAGLAQHKDDIRNEMYEARFDDESVTTSPRDGLNSAAGMEHWVDFAGETDAHPITPDRMDEIVRVSMDQATGQMYQQGVNHVLRESLPPAAAERTPSTSSAGSSLPAYLRDVASPAPSFGQDANGRPLFVNGVSQSFTEMQQLSRNGSLTSVATVTASSSDDSNGRANGTGARDLTRNASLNNVQRKPVPCISAISPDGHAVPITSDEHGPFADSHSEPPAMKQHLSMQSGRTIDDDQLQEILDSESDARTSTATVTTELRTPRHSAFVDAPESVHGSPAPVDGIRESNAIGLRESTTATPFVSGASGLRLAPSPLSGLSNADNDSHRQSEAAWKLSVRLSGQEQGFRVSFPVEQEESQR